jgi:mono/diheme cytochrome c family protein
MTSQQTRSPLRIQRAATTILLWVTACGADPAAGPSQMVHDSAAPASPIATSTSLGAAGTPAAVGPASTPASPSAAAPGVTPPSAAPSVGFGSLPCAVDNVLKTSCQSCHGVMPIGGAPMALVTYADLLKPSATQPSRKVYEVVKDRIHDSKRPMPPVDTLKPADVAAIDAWASEGAKSAPASDATSCMPSQPSSQWEGARALDGSRGKLSAGPGETCYEFKVHGGTTPDDTTKFKVSDGEFYEQFYYKVPWPAGTVATAYATIGDNVAVLHHWLLFSTNEAQPEGAHIVAPYPTLIGTDPVLLAGWAVGGPNLVAPADVGLELPDPGTRTINVQWHFYNSTGMPQTDASSLQICTVPKATRKNIGSVTWLGTEDLYGNKWFGGQGMPAHQKTKFTTTCAPGRANVATNEPIHILGFEPHMHRIGKQMTTAVKKADGSLTTIFDKPFSFGNETHYFADYDLQPGEQLVTSCLFDNDNDFNVTYGESSDTEMCYQFTFAYPAHALTNGAPSILGVPDTCWGSTTPTAM